MSDEDYIRISELEQLIEEWQSLAGAMVKEGYEIRAEELVLCSKDLEALINNE